MPQPFLSDRDWVFALGPDVLWDRIVSVDEYTRWWPWLRHFDPVGGFGEGARWACEVAPPLPYVVRFTVHLDRVDRGVQVQATVSGDIEGRAQLTVSGNGNDGSHARLRSRLNPSDPLLRRAARLARPVVGWGHDRVLDQGRRQFVSRAINGSLQPGSADRGR